MSKKTYVISDIHIGTNVPTNWYQASIHEPYLEQILTEISNKALPGDEFIILGDLFDFWTYPPEQKPPTAAEIIAANPNILGPDGALAKVISLGGVDVSYLHGNHDITTTQDDLNLISDKIRLRPDIYIKDGVVYTHGHIYTIFNAPDPNHRIPVGHFVTRALSHYLAKKHEGAANEPGFGVPAVKGPLVANILVDLIKKGSPEKISVTTDFLNAIQEKTGIDPATPIILPHDLGVMTYREALEAYSGLWAEWITANDQPSGSGRGFMYNVKSASADADGSFLGWFGQQLAMQTNVDLVVMGHTHVPEQGLKNGIIGYMNTGFECVPLPDMKKQRMTYGVVTIEDGKPPQSEIFAVTRIKDAYTIKPYDPGRADLISRISLGDFSCYVTVVNNSGEDLQLVEGSVKAAYGYFTVMPPKLIRAWETVQFWIQDKSVDWHHLIPNPFAGTHGSEGSVSYQGKTSKRRIDLSFECPTGGFSNKCHGTDEFYTRSNSVTNQWGGKNRVKGKGDPFFVKFVVNDGSKSNWTPGSTLAKLVETAGFLYDPDQEIIYSRMNPLQRDFGYAYAYDKFATAMDFDIDCEPIFFEYNNKTWRIELWKGQYGFETGCEIGVYNRDTTDDSLKYTLLDLALGESGDPYQRYYYSCAGDDDLLVMSFTLYRSGQKLFSRGPEKHWWLTGFKWGIYSERRDLTMDISITLKDAAMTSSFVQALKKLNYTYSTKSNTVTFTFDEPHTVQPPAIDIAGVKADNQAMVAAYNALNLKSNDPNLISDALDEKLTDSIVGYGSFFRRMVDVVAPSIEHWLHITSDLRNFKVADFSCAVEFRNWSGDTMLLHDFGVYRSTFPPGQHLGAFVVAPPEKIMPGDTGRLLLQDNFGVHGGEGWVKYDLVDAGGNRKQVEFAFGCPTGVYDNYVKIHTDDQLPDNFISYVAASGGTSVDAGTPNKTPHKGHPLHVRFTIGTEKPQPKLVSDVSGYWDCPEDDGKYYFRQVGDAVYWFGEWGAQEGEYWSNVGYGTLSGGKLTARWVDVPKGMWRNPGGTVSFIVSDDYNRIDFEKGVHGIFKTFTRSATSHHASNPLTYGTARAAPDTGLTAVWNCADGSGKLYIRQLDERVIWFGESAGQQEIDSWATVGYGSIDIAGGKVNVTAWADVPRGSRQQAGSQGVWTLKDGGQTIEWSSGGPGGCTVFHRSGGSNP